MPSAENAISSIKLFAFPTKILIIETVLPYILEEWISKNIPAKYRQNIPKNGYSILDSRSSNSKLWKLVKAISKEQPQFEKCRTIQSTDGLLAQNDEQAANILREHCQLISTLNFTGNDKYAMTVTSNVVHGCHSNSHLDPAIFSRAFSVQELDAAILDLLNDSWRLDRLPQDWRKAIVVPIRKPDKDIASAGSFRPIALNSITYAQNKKPTNYNIAAFPDLSNAFDRFRTRKQVTKLYVKFGIRGRALPWIYDFFRDRYIRSSGFDIEEVEESVNLALADMWNFAVNHKLSLSPSKSTVSFFLTIRKLYNFRPRILLNSQLLKLEKHPWYLGSKLDPEILSNKHLYHLALRARKRVKILKCISSRDWGADAGTIRNPYVSLIRPILEYGLPNFCCSYDSNSHKHEWVQLCAARIITGLRSSCPKDIMLYEDDLQQLSLRRNACLVKYYSKLSSLGFQNRTSKFPRSWSSHQRLK
ncbi:putative RNA-directed DNA polymerase from transposon BS [Trichonephila clavipes]|nr:putative RNA-directed DNA polymerase from transposon BS [Trichonephila clavipes]